MISFNWTLNHDTTDFQARVNCEGGWLVNG